LVCGRNSAVECNLAKVDVEGSIPFARSKESASLVACLKGWPMPTRLTVDNYPEILVIKDFIDNDICNILCDFANKQKGHKISVVGEKNAKGGVSTYVNTEVRDTAYISTDEVDDVVNEIMFNIFHDQVQPHFKVEIDWWEKSQLLAYDQGGKYHTHADSDNYDVATQSWKKCMDRDISVLLYLNEEFTGGHLHFKNQNISVRPSRGLLVAFPSDARYEHAAQPVESGKRYVLVSWARVKNVPRVLASPPYGVTYMDKYAGKANPVVIG
jgi:predicted 2-oxoglutarate/Fe(II)-dependent dioxygenase YbiX